jgi:hypothetical protein
MFGLSLSKKQKEADRVHALVEENARGLLATLSDIYGDPPVIPAEPFNPPPVRSNGNGNGKHKISVQQVEERHKSLLNMSEKVNMMSRVLVHVERRSHHAIGE